MPKVSVIIPVYNAGSYLCQCLDSVVNQTLHDIEIICVDDGSTDNSYDILQNYAGKDNRMVVLQQPNSGAGIARNAGMCIAKGEYLSILDADDYFELNMLELAYLQCQKDDSDICVFRSDQFNMATQEYEQMLYTINSEYLPNRTPFYAKEIYGHIFQLFNGWSWDKLYRREFIERTGLQFQDLRTTNDAFFVFMANIQAGKISIIDDVLAHHRANVKTSLSETREQSWDCCWKAVYAIQKELQARGQFQLVEQSFINWALHFLLWNLYTLQGTGKEKFQQALQKAYFRKLKIHKYPELFFYNIAEYHEFLRIARADSFWYKCEINCWKAMHYYKNQGFLAVIKKILKKIL